MIEKKGNMTMEELDHKIYTLLNRIGVPTNLCGYDYVFSAVRIVVNNGYALSRLTGSDGLYAKIAKQCNSTAERVERCIRHAIDVTFNERISPELALQLFGSSYNPSKGKTTSGDFIRNLALNLRYNA